MFDIQQLEVFQAVARSRSLAAAARALQVSRPTVTHHLEALETQVRAPLVRRDPRGVELTDLGEVLLGHADAILDRVEIASAELRSLATLGVATLRVGTFPSAGAILLPEAVRRVRERTGLRVELHEAETPALLAALRARDVHCALVYDVPTPENRVPREFEGLRVVRLLRDPFLAAVPEDHPGAGLAQIPMAMFEHDEWILSPVPQDPGDLAIHAAAEAAGFDVAVAMRTDNYDVALGFVAAGLGVAMVAELAASPREGVVLRPVSGLRLTRTISVALLPDRPTPALQEMVHSLREVARERRGAARP